MLKGKYMILAGVAAALAVVLLSTSLVKKKDPKLTEQNKAGLNNTTNKDLPIKEIEQFILKKTKSNGEKFGDKLPSSTSNGKYAFVEDGGWVGGFWPGINLLSYEMSNDKTYLDKARQGRTRLRSRLYVKPDSLDHDVGFLYATAFEADYKLTGDKDSKQVALDAADTLIKRFNNKGNFIQAWNIWGSDKFSQDNKGRFIMDTMFNLPLLFWASEETGDAKYKNIAVAHADTTMKYLVRPDGTTFHTYVMDPATGAPKYGQTYQGYADSSCWARGQAWAVGGFTYAYRYTKDKRYLEVAEKCAKVFIDNLEEDYVPTWDLTLKGKSGEPRDTSAAAIAANAMLELSQYVDESKKEYYQETAKKILISLYKNYSTAKLDNEEGLLLHACGNKPQKKDEDCSLIYGDYYFTEAIAKLAVNNKKTW